MLEGLLKEIAEDNLSGAAETLKRAARVFDALAARPENHRLAGVEEARRLVIQTSAALVQAQPDMAPLANLASRAVGASLGAASAGGALQAASNAAQVFLKDAERAAVAVSDHGCALIGEGAVVLTHSRSSTVLAAILKARRQGMRFTVIATESRPMLEGRALALELAREGVSVCVIADAAAAVAMERADLILLGADKITPLGLVNKIGTRMIALAAHARGVPAYALCDSSKFIALDPRNFFGGERRSDGELWPDAPPGVAVMNRYFEPTPARYFTKIVAEEGPLAAEEAARRAEAASIEQVLVDAIGGLST